jgi:hypothetical protein
MKKITNESMNGTTKESMKESRLSWDQIKDFCETLT